MEININISKDGKVLTGLYNDKFQWTDLGTCNIKRATEVLFDAHTQKWVVSILDEKGRMLPGRYEHRRDAIAAEVDYLNQRGYIET